MEKSHSTMARQVAEAARACEQRRTGHVPKSVTVVRSDHTLVSTLHEALSPAERALASSPAGTAEVQVVTAATMTLAVEWDEVLLADPRGRLTPAEMVDRKLLALFRKLSEESSRWWRSAPVTKSPTIDLEEKTPCETFSYSA